MDRTSSWLLGKLDELRPGSKPDLDIAAELGRVVEVIWGRTGMVFGMVVGNIDRDAVLGRGAEVMSAWLPHLPTNILRQYEAVARRTSLPIDTAPYLVNANRLDAEAAAAADAEAAAAHAAFVARKAEAVSKEPRNPALLAALGESAEPYSVYADWLEAQGAARGELIHLMLAAETDESLNDQVAGFIHDHARELIGLVPRDYGDLEQPPETYELLWKRGFIDRIALGAQQGIAAALEHFLEHPSGQRLRSLAIGMADEADSDTTQYDHVVEILARERPPHLEVVQLGMFGPNECDISWFNVGDVSPLWQLPALKSVTVRGGSFTLGSIVAPQLESLILQTGGLTHDNVVSIADGQWDNLRELDVMFGGHEYGGDTEPHHVDILLAANLPKLRRLGIMNCPFADEAVATFVASPLAAQIEDLDLSLGCLGDAGAEALIANRNKLVALKRLNVSASYLSPDVERALGQIGVELIAEGMNGPADPEDRYVSISE
ncbi:MAG: hypothetical protein QM831_42115 [Kofleriaceae bacterium]